MQCVGAGCGQSCPSAIGAQRTAALPGEINPGRAAHGGRQTLRLSPVPWAPGLEAGA